MCGQVAAHPDGATDPCLKQVVSGEVFEHREGPLQGPPTAGGCRRRPTGGYSNNRVRDQVTERPGRVVGPGVPVQDRLADLLAETERVGLERVPHRLGLLDLQLVLGGQLFGGEIAARQVDQVIERPELQMVEHAAQLPHRFSGTQQHAADEGQPCLQPVAGCRCVVARCPHEPSALVFGRLQRRPRRGERTHRRRPDRRPAVVERFDGERVGSLAVRGLPLGLPLAGLGHVLVVCRSPPDRLSLTSGVFLAGGSGLALGGLQGLGIGHESVRCPEEAGGGILPPHGLDLEPVAETLGRASGPPTGRDGREALGDHGERAGAGPKLTGLGDDRRRVTGDREVEAHPPPQGRNRGVVPLPRALSDS